MFAQTRNPAARHRRDAQWRFSDVARFFRHVALSKCELTSSSGSIGRWTTLRDGLGPLSGPEHRTLVKSPRLGRSSRMATRDDPCCCTKRRRVARRWRVTTTIHRICKKYRNKYSQLFIVSAFQPTSHYSPKFRKTVKPTWLSYLVLQAKLIF